jgi:hypothetical protein
VANFVATKPIQPLAVKAGSAFTFEIPQGTFTHENVSEPLQFKATLADGRPLPSWISFNEQTQTFTGEAPDGSQQQLEVIVTAIDSSANEAQLQLTIKID